MSTANVISKHTPKTELVTKFFDEAGFTSEGTKVLLDHPCEAIVKTDVLYNGRAIFLVRNKLKCGIMDAAGNMIVPYMFDTIIAPESYRDKNAFCVNSYYNPKRGGGKPWGAIRLDGTQITDLFTFSYMYGFKNGHCIVKNGEKDYAIIDTEGNYLIPFGIYTNMYYTNRDNEIKATSIKGEEVYLDTITLKKL